MDDIISTDQLDLNNLTYSQFLNQFKIYPSRRAAYCKGYEAHHIIPVAIQGFPRGDSRLDDRCIRCTSFEHILIHYLSARDLGGAYIDIFYNMYHKNHKKVTDLNSIKLEELQDWGVLLERGRKSQSEKKKLKYQLETPEEKAVRREKCKLASNTPETKKKRVESRKKYMQNLSLEEYQNYCNTRKSYYTSETAKRNMSEGQKKYHQNLTPEGREVFRQRCQKSATAKAPRFQRRRQLYLEKIKTGEFKGSWNEFQIWCRLENERSFKADFEEVVKTRKISRTTFYEEWKKRAPY